MDLLARLVKNPSWCATVADECAMSSRIPDLEDMSVANGIFGDPLFPETPAEHLLTQTYRMKLSRPGDPPHKNLGEAETLAIIHSRGMRAVFFTDDGGPAGLLVGSGTDGPAVQIAGTWELLRVAYRAGFVDSDTLWSYVSILRGKNRHLPPGDASHRRPAFDVWLTA
ncbi:hypothetical protein [Leifsonia xyli]|uniref:hypothetical protein n=1 Tax=Leifsonia xyli TaxID=1575 RepID=UPI003D6727F2